MIESGRSLYVSQLNVKKFGSPRHDSDMQTLNQVLQLNLIIRYSIYILRLNFLVVQTISNQ